MSGWTIGEVCAGTGMLGMALSLAFGADLSWYAESDKDASKVAEARHPGIPNHGDIKTMTWEDSEPVDILCGGIPCQGASQAGNRKGIEDDRWLWPYLADGITRLRRPPSVVVVENVPGLLTVNKGAAFAQVVTGLAALGYVGAYGVYSAAEAGAPHLRKRLFIIGAHPRGYGRAILAGAAALADADREPRLQRRLAEPGEAAGGRPRADARRPGGASAAVAGGGGRGPEQPGVHEREPDAARGGAGGGAAVALLPTPNATRVGSRMDTQLSGDGRETPNKLGWAIGALLPTPSAAAGTGGQSSRSGDRKGEPLLGGIVKTFIPDEKRLPTPNASDWKGGNAPVGRERGDGRTRTAGDADLPAAVEMLADGQLLPTPMTSYSQRSADQWRAGRPAGNGQEREQIGDLEIAVKDLLPTPSVSNSHGNAVNSRGELLLPGAAESMALLPTPLSGEARHGSPGQHRSRGDTMLTGEVLALAGQEGIKWDWRAYGPAVRRWELVRGMAAPAPVEPGKGGKPRLAAEFAEWMMGMPWIGIDCDGPGPDGGWVTGVPGLPRSAQLKIIGNGVVWRQALMAVCALAPSVLRELG